jgi:hypothetical protein
LAEGVTRRLVEERTEAPVRFGDGVN